MAEFIVHWGAGLVGLLVDAALIALQAFLQARSLFLVHVCTREEHAGLLDSVLYADVRGFLSLASEASKQVMCVLAGLKVFSFPVMRQPIEAPVQGHRVELAGVPVQSLVAFFDVVNDTHVGHATLGKDDGHAVVPSQIPHRMHLQAWIIGHGGNLAIGDHRGHFRSVYRAGH